MIIAAVTRKCAVIRGSYAVIRAIIIAAVTRESRLPAATRGYPRIARGYPQCFVFVHTRAVIRGYPRCTRQRVTCFYP